MPLVHSVLCFRFVQFVSVLRISHTARTQLWGDRRSVSWRWLIIGFITLVGSIRTMASCSFFHIRHVMEANFPSVSREAAIAALEEAKALLASYFPAQKCIWPKLAWMG